MEGKPGYECQLRRRGGRRGIVQQQRRVKISGRRCPCSAPPSPSRALLRRDDPKRAAFPRACAPKCFRIGGVDKVEDYDAFPDRSAFMIALRFLHSTTNVVFAPAWTRDDLRLILRSLRTSAHPRHAHRTSNAVRSGHPAGKHRDAGRTQLR
jgi:hypothetical protein